MIKTLNVNVEEVIKELKQTLEEISVDNKIEIDVSEDLISDLTKREIEVFAKKAAILKLIAKIQEDM